MISYGDQECNQYGVYGRVSLGYDGFILPIVTANDLVFGPLGFSLLSLNTGEKLFMGWFGPRGLASIVFAVIVLNEQLPGGGVIIMTVVCTIVLSIIAHGLSATPLVAALTARIKLSVGDS